MPLLSIRAHILKRIYGPDILGARTLSLAHKRALFHLCAINCAPQ
jgi:hypothetical protein